MKTIKVDIKEFLCELNNKHVYGDVAVDVIRAILPEKEITIHDTGSFIGDYFELINAPQDIIDATLSLEKKDVSVSDVYEELTGDFLFCFDDGKYLIIKRERDY